MTRHAPRNAAVKVSRTAASWLWHKQIEHRTPADCVSLGFDDRNLQRSTEDVELREFLRLIGSAEEELLGESL
jgi:hypothetical protein